MDSEIILYEHNTSAGTDSLICFDISDDNKFIARARITRVTIAGFDIDKQKYIQLTDRFHVTFIKNSILCINLIKFISNDRIVICYNDNLNSSNYIEIFDMNLISIHLITNCDDHRIMSIIEYENDKLIIGTNDGHIIFFDNCI